MVTEFEVKNQKIMIELLQQIKRLNNNLEIFIEDYELNNQILGYKGEKYQNRK